MEYQTRLPCFDEGLVLISNHNHHHHPIPLSLEHGSSIKSRVKGCGSLVGNPDLSHLGSKVVVSVTLVGIGILSLWADAVGELGAGVGSIRILCITEVINGSDWRLVVGVGCREWRWRRDGGNIAVCAVCPGAVGVEGKSVSSHGVAGLWGNDGDTVARVWGRGPGGSWRAGTAADEIKDVEGDAAGWLLGGWHVWVVGLKVAIKDVVVPVSLVSGGTSLGELDVKSPSAGGGLGWGHIVSSGVVVPRTEELDGLDVWGNQKSEGVAGRGRHFDFRVMDIRTSQKCILFCVRRCVRKSAS